MDDSDWVCDRCKRRFSPSDVPELVPTDGGNKFIHPDRCPSLCRQCHHEGYAHSPFHGGKCIAAMCDCPAFAG